MGSIKKPVLGLPEDYVETLREILLDGDMAMAQSLVAEFDSMLSQRAGINKSDVYSNLRDEVLRGFVTPQRACYESFLLEAGAF
jgi:hypothetical protein